MTVAEYMSGYYDGELMLIDMPRNEECRNYAMCLHISWSDDYNCWYIDGNKTIDDAIQTIELLAKFMHSVPEEISPYYEHLWNAYGEEVFGKTHGRNVQENRAMRQQDDMTMDNDAKTSTVCHNIIFKIDKYMAKLSPIMTLNAEECTVVRSIMQKYMDNAENGRGIIENEILQA